MSHVNQSQPPASDPLAAQRELTRRQSVDRVRRSLDGLVREGKLDPEHLRLSQLIAEVVLRELHHQFSLHELEHRAPRPGARS